MTSDYQLSTGPRSLAERRAADDRRTRDAWEIRRRRLQSRIRNGNAVPYGLLQPFKGEAWADQHLAAGRSPSRLRRPTARKAA